MSSRVGVNLRASAYLHQGDRKYMEDEFQVAYQRTHDKKDIEYAFFGIFDGHGGKEAANFAKDNLMDNIVSQRMFWSDNDEDVLSAIKEGFLQTHLAMWKVVDQWPRTASGWPSTSGTTASIAFIRRQKIYIGHVGDSGIVLGYEDDYGNEWVGESLTRDHKPESVMEMSRINKCGGKVVAKCGVPRVVWNRPKSGHQGPVRRSTPMDEIPFLAVARSLGDLWSYNAINDRFVVSPEPDVCVLDIDINVHRCLIFGTDGLWNALSPTSAVNTAYYTEKNNEKHYLGLPLYSGKARLWVNPSRSIVSGALNRYQNAILRADNTSAVTVFLDPPGLPKREVLLSQYSVKKGTPTKNSNSPNTNKSPTKNKPNREASVQVHVYNQNQNGGKDENNRGLFKIKERIPFGWGGGGDDDDNSPSSRDNCPSSPPPEDRRRSIVHETIPQPSEENCSSNTNIDHGTKDPCAECGCHSNSPSKERSSEKSSSLDKSYREEALSELKEANNDIQIPVISSSTSDQNSSIDDITTKKQRNTNIRRRTTRSTRKNENVTISKLILLPKYPPHTLRFPPTTLRTPPTTLRSPTPLTLRSPTPPLETKESLLKTRSSIRQHAATKLPAVVGDDDAAHPPADASNRILKNVNRSDKIVDSNSLLSKNRKRPRDFVANDEDRNQASKSIRINTRSHAQSRKPMVTRSQDKKVDK